MRVGYAITKAFFDHDDSAHSTIISWIEEMMPPELWRVITSGVWITGICGGSSTGKRIS